MTLTPAVPGAINITDLQGDEVVSLQSGAGSTQTTTQDIANLGGGGGITITDGSHTVDGATQLTVTGGTVGGSTPDATLTISGAGVFLTTGKISLTSAQILNIGASPVTIVEAPGAGKFISVMQAVYEAIFGSEAYSGTDAGLYYGDSAGQSADGGDGGIFQATSSSVQSDIGGIGLTDLTAVENLPVVYTGVGTPYSGGDGTGAITVLYSVITL